MRPNISLSFRNSAVPLLESFGRCSEHAPRPLNCAPDGSRTPEKPEAFAAAEVHDPTLLLVDFDFAARRVPRAVVFPPPPSASHVACRRRSRSPGRPRISPYFDGGVLAVTRSLLRPLQHPVDLGKVDVTEQRRNHPALRNALLPAGFEHDLQQVHHVRIVHGVERLSPDSRSCRTLSK